MHSSPLLVPAALPFIIGGAAKVAITIIGLGVLIFVHELGHFIAAKLMGVRVERFAIGFGPRIVGFQRGVTEYAICWIPFGGYVRMAGEYPHQDREGKAYEFYSKPPGKRCVIAIAGVFMNAVTAVLIFILAFELGVQLVSSTVSPIGSGPAWSAGIETGDTILSINGKKVRNFIDIAHRAAVSEGQMDLEILRNGKTLNMSLTPELNKTLGIYSIGVGPVASLTVGDAGRVLKSAEAPAIRDKDVIVEAGGEKILNIRHFRRIVSEHPGKELSIGLLRDGQRVDVTVVPEKTGGWTFGCSSKDELTADAVRQNGPAWNAGLRAGDTILSLNGTPLTDYTEFQNKIAQSPDTEVMVGIRRNGKDKELSVTPRYVAEYGAALIGVAFHTDPVIGSVAPGSPAEKAGLRSGDRIVSVELDGNAGSVDTWSDFETVTRYSNGKALSVTWERGGKTFTEDITGIVNPSLQKGFLGMGFLPVYKETHLGFVESATFGIRSSFVWGKRVLETLQGLVTRRVSLKAVSGPLGIPRMGVHYVERGPGTFLYFLGILGVNFAVLNLLPLPVLDGGLLLLFGIERIRRKPLDKKTQALVQNVSAALLIAFILLITVQDVGRIIQDITGIFSG